MRLFPDRPTLPRVRYINISTDSACTVAYLIRCSISGVNQPCALALRSLSIYCTLRTGLPEEDGESLVGLSSV